MDASKTLPIVTLTDGPEYGLAGMAFTPDGKTVFVVNYQGPNVYAFPAKGPFPIDLKNQDPVVTGFDDEGPSGIAFSTDGNQIFVANDQTGFFYAFPAKGPFPYTVTDENKVVTGMLNALDVATLPPAAPATNLTLKQYVNSFPFCKEFVNTLTWTASVTPTVVSYEVYRDGELLDVVSGTTYQDQTSLASKTYTYKVRAVTEAGVRSAFISVVGP